MKSSLISRELLLFTGSGFSNAAWNTKGCFHKKTSQLTKNENGRDYWPGKLYELLPGVAAPALNLERWEVQFTWHFIVITESVRPASIDTVTSIDPRQCLPAMCYS